MVKRIFFGLTVFLLTLALAGCPTDGGGNGGGNENGGNENGGNNGGGTTPVGPVNQDDVPWRTFKRSVLQERDGDNAHPWIIHEMWIGIDTWADPRNVLTYRLASDPDRHFFDNVVLFHTNLNWRHLDPSHGQTPDAPDLPGPRNHFCPVDRAEAHLHLHDRMQWLLAGDEIYLQPIREAGMRLLLCPIPGGQGVTYGTIGGWPGPTVNNPTAAQVLAMQEPNWPAGAEHWYDEMGFEYPMDDAFAQQFAQELVDFFLYYGFDGLALDEEFVNAGGSGWGLRHNVMGWNRIVGGANTFRLLTYFVDYSAYRGYVDPRPRAPRPAMSRETRCVQEGMWVSVYVFGNYVTAMPNYMIVSSPWYNNGAPTRRYSHEVIHAAFPAQYGSTMMSFANLPRARLSHTAIAFDAFPAVLPGVSQIRSIMQAQLMGGFGIVFYFALQDREFYHVRPFFGAMGSQPESFLSHIAQVLYRDNVIHHGRSYIHFPRSTGGRGTYGTLGTAAIHRPDLGVPSMDADG